MCGVERPFLDEQKFLKRDHNPLFSLIDDRTDRTEPNRTEAYYCTHEANISLSLSYVIWTKNLLRHSVTNL